MLFGCRPRLLMGRSSIACCPSAVARISRGMRHPSQPFVWSMVARAARAGQCRRVLRFVYTGAKVLAGRPQPPANPIRARALRELTHSRLVSGTSQLRSHVSLPMPRTTKPRGRTKAESPQAHAEGSPPAASLKRSRENRAPSARPSSANGAGTAGDAADVTTGLARTSHRVPAEQAAMRTDEDILPESPRQSHGLFELVSSVARRALELGLSAREPSFHVFVAAAPEVMIEDDIVRYASRFAGERPTPNDIVYVHDFDHPEAPLPLLLPASAGPSLVAALDRLIERLQAGDPGGGRGRGVQARPSAPRRRARGQEPRGHSPARVAGQDAGLRSPRGARQRSDLPDPARQASERRAVRRPRRIDQARAHRQRREAHAARSRKRRSSSARKAPGSRRRARRSSPKPRASSSRTR